MIYPTKEKLEELYCMQRMTMRVIALSLGVSVGLIHKLIHQFGIPARPRFQGMKGKRLSEEARRAVSKANKGKHLSDETRLKISCAARGRILHPSQFGGHVKILRNGYRLVYLPNHPNAHKDGYALEHVVAYGKYHNCIVDTDKYVIHHINGIKTDNREENLMMMTKSDHMSLHSTKRHELRRYEKCKNLSQSAT